MSGGQWPFPAILSICTVSVFFAYSPTVVIALYKAL